MLGWIGFARHFYRGGGGLEAAMDTFEDVIGHLIILGELDVSLPLLILEAISSLVNGQVTKGVSACFGVENHSGALNVPLVALEKIPWK